MSVYILAWSPVWDHTRPTEESNNGGLLFLFSSCVALYSFPNSSFRDVCVCVAGDSRADDWCRPQEFPLSWMGTRGPICPPRLTQLSGNNTLGLFRQNSFLKVFFFLSLSLPLPPLFLLCYNVFSIFNHSRVNFLPMIALFESKVRDVKWTGPHIYSLAARVRLHIFRLDLRSWVTSKTSLLNLIIIFTSY